MNPARGEETLKRRQGVTRVPVGIAGPHDVAPGGIDVEGRREKDPALQLPLEIGPPFGAPRLDRLVDQTGDLREAPLLVRHVVVGRIIGDPVIAQQALEMAVEMGDALKPHRSGPVGIDLGYASLGQMRDRSEAQPAGLGDRRFGDRRRIVEELDAVMALRRRPTDPGSSLVRARHRPIAPAVAQSEVGKEPRGDDRVGGAPRPVAQRHVVGPEIKRDAANSGDSMRQPKAIAVAGIGRLVGIAIMAVNVDEARKDEHSRGVDLAVEVARLAVGSNRKAGRSGAADALDPVAGDDDVDRASGRRSGAVDQGRAANDEATERPLAFPWLPVGDPLHPGAVLSLKRRHGGRPQSKNHRRKSQPDRTHPPHSPARRTLSQSYSRIHGLFNGVCY